MSPVALALQADSLLLSHLGSLKTPDIQKMEANLCKTEYGKGYKKRYMKEEVSTSSETSSHGDKGAMEPQREMQQGVLRRQKRENWPQGSLLTNTPQLTCWEGNMSKAAKEAGC